MGYCFAYFVAFFAMVVALLIFLCYSGQYRHAAVGQLASSAPYEASGGALFDEIAAVMQFAEFSCTSCQLHLMALYVLL